MSVYYVDPVTGSDANSGRSPGSPWQTLAEVNGHVFRSGDRVLLTGTFSGQSLSLGPDATGVTGDTYTGICRECHYSWRDRELDPATTIALCVQQVVRGNIPCSEVRHVAAALSLPTTFTAQAFGVPSGPQPGCAFPVAHLLVLFSAATGMLIDAWASPLWTSDLAETPEAHLHLDKGDILIGVGTWKPISATSRRR